MAELRCFNCDSDELHRGLVLTDETAKGVLVTY